MLTHVVLASLLLTKVSATCYWPTGNATFDRDAYEHQPCSSDPSNPMSRICCALNRTNPSGGKKEDGRTSDECLPNGICRNRVLNRGTMEVSYWRETCTEQDWKKGLCLGVCHDVWTAGNLMEGSIMTPCDDTPGSLKWCCGFDKSCCNDESKVKILPFEFGGAIPLSLGTPTPTPTSTSSNSASSTSSADSSTTSTLLTASTTTTPLSSDAKDSAPLSANANEKNEEDKGLSTAAKAGIGVGAGVGAIALVALGFLLARSRRKDDGDEEPMRSPPPLPEKHPRYFSYEVPDTPRVQLEDTEHRKRESPEGRVELHAVESLATYLPGGGYNKTPL
ncbi:hypothetical protein M011DRAFT_478031 [Sporormia fimetaria CBS 119925]|uniref:Mid2 domain-containing protein n=1 Tax=Sporormia fimetaria CBS 119925 TaxID=1340428 RepID=A0A6A6VA56_9PLEO|nr:hypothetical protein M011DRAFT_478031 [Sporormia fimetaria CBS 119925]